MEQLALFLVGLVALGETDKQKHFAIGAAASAYVTHVTDSPLKGCLAAAALGLGKELFDRHRGGEFDNRDLGATTIGCVITFRF